MLICELLEDTNSNRTEALRSLIAKRFDAELLPDNDNWMNRFRIKSSSSDATYVVAQRRFDHTWACGCKGWATHRKCKHLTKMLLILQKAFG